MECRSFEERFHKLSTYRPVRKSVIEPVSISSVVERRSTVLLKLKELLFNYHASELIRFSTSALISGQIVASTMFKYTSSVRFTFRNKRPTIVSPIIPDTACDSKNLRVLVTPVLAVVLVQNWSLRSGSFSFNEQCYLWFWTITSHKELGVPSSSKIFSLLFYLILNVLPLFAFFIYL